MHINVHKMFVKMHIKNVIEIITNFSPVFPNFSTVNILVVFV